MTSIPRIPALKPLVELFSENAFSHTLGILGELSIPRPLLHTFLKAYVAAYDVDMSVVAKELHEFESFNEFFTRAIKPEARPVDQAPDVLVSPVDAVLTRHGTFDGCLLEQIKGHTYSMTDLVGSAMEAKPYMNGTYATLYLSPRHYHRIHSPADGRITAIRYIPGRLYPVNRLGIYTIQGLLAKNERIVIHIDTDRGPVCLVCVGASVVGRVSVSCHHLQTNVGDAPGSVVMSPPIEVRRGEEVARFNVGSTVVMIVPPGSFRFEGLQEQDDLLLGQRLGRYLA